MKIIGHVEQLKKLDNILKTYQIANAYIFEGMEGIGKLTVAKDFAEKIIGNDNYILIKSDDGVIKVDTIRALRDEIVLKPITSSRKVVIIDNAEYMNEQAQNALLKILEEPPEYATIILIVANKEKLLYTIKSRCVLFKFHALSNEEIEEYFNEKIDDELLEYGRGSIGRILKARENDDSNIIKEWVNALKNDSLIDTLKNISSLKDDKYAKNNLLDFFEYLLFQYYKELKQGSKCAVKAIDIVEETRRNISKNANSDIALDRMVIYLWKWRKECKKS